MRSPRFKIRTLLGVVLFVAIAIAALRASTDSWDGWLFALTSLILLTAVLLVVHRTDRRRAYWLGFALFGWAYIVASLIPPIGSRLPTTMGLALLDSKIPGRETMIRAVAFSPQGGTLTSSSQGVVRLWDATTGKLLAGPNGSTENFIRIGHSLLALVLAFFGGHLSRYLYNQDQGESMLSSRDSPAST